MLPLPPDLLTRLQARYEDLCSEGFRPEELQGAFVFGLDRPVDVNAPNHFLRRLVARIRAEHLEFPEVRIHDLRHTAASLMLARGLDVSLVADKLGHATPNVTLGIYRHLLQEERKAGVLPLEDLLSGPRHTA